MATTLNLTLTINDDAKALEILAAFAEIHDPTATTVQDQRAAVKREVIRFVKKPWLDKREILIRQAGRQQLAAEDASVTIT